MKQNPITVEGACSITEAAVQNKKCLQVYVNDEYITKDDKVRNNMSILDKRKKARNNESIAMYIAI